MPSTLSNALLLQISKGEKTTIAGFRLGVHLTSTSGATIEDLTEQACRDRFRLAKRMLQCARIAIKGPKPQNRVALARAYYAIYHATRAVVFFCEQGDDYQEHSVLPKHIPRDFPDRARWENDIKTARLERNRADYDPYPKGDHAFAKAAKSTLKTAEDLLPTAKAYLLRKGCAL